MTTSLHTTVTRRLGRLALSALLLGSWANIAAAAPSTVLLNRVENASGTDWAAAQVVVGTFDTDAIVFVTASGRATGANAPARSGILVSIVEDSQDIAVRDDSFEAQSLNLNYRAAVSRVIVLPRGERLVLNGRVDPLGDSPSLNQGTRLRLEVVAIAAD